MFRNIVITTLIACFSYSFAHATESEDQIAQNCESSVPEDIIIGSEKYWNAVDECIKENSIKTAKKIEEEVPTSNE